MSCILSISWNSVKTMTFISSLASLLYQKFRLRTGREQEAVTEAQQMRSEQSARAAAQCEAHQLDGAKGLMAIK